MLYFSRHCSLLTQNWIAFENIHTPPCCTKINSTTSTNGGCDNGSMGEGCETMSLMDDDEAVSILTDSIGVSLAKPLSLGGDAKKYATLLNPL